VEDVIKDKAYSLYLSKIKTKYCYPKEIFFESHPDRFHYIQEVKIELRKIKLKKLQKNLVE